MQKILTINGADITLTISAAEYRVLSSLKLPEYCRACILDIVPRLDKAIGHYVLNKHGISLKVAGVTIVDILHGMGFAGILSIKDYKILDLAAALGTKAFRAQIEWNGWEYDAARLMTDGYLTDRYRLTSVGNTIRNARARGQIL